MARFSVGNEGESGVSRGNKRRSTRNEEDNRVKAQRVGEEEEEENHDNNEEEEEEKEEEEEELRGNDNNQNLTRSTENEGYGRISVTIDRDLLRCNKCFLSLAPPLFQCQNGHVVCSDCCNHLDQDQCPCRGCREPIKSNQCRALENVIESMMVPCTFSRYGCKQKLPNAEIDTHQDSCLHAPYHCPIKYCFYATPGSSHNQLSKHLHVHHNAFTTDFEFGSHFVVWLKKDEPFHVLHEKKGSLYLLLNDRTSSHLGVNLSVVCIQRNQSPLYSIYDLKFEDPDYNSSLRLKNARASVIREWDGVYQEQPVLFAPHCFWDCSGLFTLVVCIREIN